MAEQISGRNAPETMPQMQISLLTGGGDPHYAYGLTKVLLSREIAVDLIGSDEHNFPEFSNSAAFRYLNLRGSVKSAVAFYKKVLRLLYYYVRLICYAAAAKPKLFHILWNNKVEIFDRTLLMLYYRWLGKKIVLTAHNVNAGRRDCKDTVLNRATLGIQYGLCHHIFVHTERMKEELRREFGVWPDRITVIPFGINNAVPNTDLSSREARKRLGLESEEKIILFFGRITPYKGLEVLIEAFRQILPHDRSYRLIIAGRPENCGGYWNMLRQTIGALDKKGQVLLKDSFIPDDQIQMYFKAADVFVLPYRHIYQSGVLFLGQSFGTPVIAANIGSFADEIIEGKTGFVFTSGDPASLASTVERYFASELYAQLDSCREKIRALAAEAHSWEGVGQLTASVYSSLTQQVNVPVKHGLTSGVMENDGTSITTRA
jgi:D-inositol-3-phosphate glycosyltransferase